MSDIRVLEVPKWGLSMEEGSIVEWLIAEGDEFTEGQEICEIESSKIVNVLEAPFTGTLRRILANAGDVLPVQAPIGVAAPADVADADVDAFVASLAPAQTAAGATADAPASSPASKARDTDAPSRTKQRHAGVVELASSSAVSVPVSLGAGADDTAVHATPRARQLAAEHGINLNNVTGSGRNGRVSEKDIRAAVSAEGGQLPAKTRHLTESVPPPKSGVDDSAVSATPLARSLAAIYGINLNDCRPTGRNGRVLKDDVEAARLRIFGPEVTESLGKGDISVEFPPTMLAFGETSLSGMRKTIATRLQASKQTAPHYRLTIECKLDALLALRKQVNAENPKAKVSVNDCIVKAAAMALIDVPECNIQFNGESVRQFEDAHVSVAVALESGLITPIVQNANRKGLVEISNETTSLVTRAKANTLKAEDFQGGTFTVSNLGMFGIKHFDAIINPPQAAILAIGAGEQRWLVENGEGVAATLVTVTLSSDHRVIDGALGARWLQAFKGYVEKPMSMLS